MFFGSCGRSFAEVAEVHSLLCPKLPYLGHLVQCDHSLKDKDVFCILSER